MNTLEYGTETIKYELTYSDRKTLGISVHPDKTVHVKAPRDASMEKIEKKLEKRAFWILEQQRYFESFEPRKKEYLYKSGESHYYLGRQYILKIIHSDEETVKYHPRYLQVFTVDKSRKNVEYLVEEWYRERAEIKMEEIMKPVKKSFEKYNVSPERIILRKMKYRWGSCSPKGYISLNPELIKAPRACVEYVIIHEFCHLVHKNHTAAFFRLLSREMPDWKKWKKKLEHFMA